MADKPIEAPTAVGRRFVRYMAGFGVGVGVGLAPFLGAVGVPGFAALLSLYPTALRGFLIPVAAFIMGLIAVVIQFVSGERTSRAKLRRFFWRATIVLGVGLVALVVTYSLLVVRVELDAAHVEAVIVSWSRVSSCPCPNQISDLQCIQDLSIDPAAIESCWGRGIKLSRLVLSLLYLISTGGFGALVGVLVAREESIRRSRARRSSG